MEVLGWIIAAISLIAAVINEIRWIVRTMELNDSWSDFCKKINDDWAQLCERQNDDWGKFYDRVINKHNKKPPDGGNQSGGKK